MTNHTNHRWVLDFAEYDIVKGQGIVMGKIHYRCAYCPKELITETALPDAELESDVVEKI